MLFFCASWLHRSWFLPDAKLPGLLFETHSPNDEKVLGFVPTSHLGDALGGRNSHYNNFPYKFVNLKAITKYLIKIFYNCLLFKPYSMRLPILSVLLVYSISAFAQNSKLNDTSIKLTGQMRSNLIKASKNNGKLDYWTRIKGHEFEGEMIEHDFYAAKEDAALIKWAYDLTIAGVKNKTDIISLYEELKGHKANNNELNYIDYAYHKALEKPLMKSIAYE